MCGRFTNQYTWRELVELYRITEPYIAPIPNLEPHFKFAPMQRGIVVCLDKEGRRRDNQCKSRDSRGKARLSRGVQGEAVSCGCGRVL
jgi:putative SOS response-associated peptidase YedK